MLFYKVEAVAASSPLADEKLSNSEVITEIRRNTEEFNRKLREDAFYFLSRMNDNCVVFGAIYARSTFDPKEFSSFMGALGIELKSFNANEVTFGEIRMLLAHSDHREFIDDEDEALEAFGMGRYDFNGMSFGDNLAAAGRKNTFIKEARLNLLGESLIPEIERIFSGRNKSAVYGHPVHYIIETDNCDLRRTVWKILLGALYSKKRIVSSRYCFTDIGLDSDIDFQSFENVYKSCTGGAFVLRVSGNAGNEDGEYANRLAGVMKDVCEITRKYRNDVLTVFSLPRECSRLKEMIFENLGNMSMIEIKEEFAANEKAKDYLRLIAKENNIAADESLFAKVKKDETYLSPDLREMFDEWYDGRLKTVVFPQYSEVAAVRQKAKDAAPKGDAYGELQDMIGLSEAKNVIQKALNYYKMQKLCMEMGMEKDKPVMHMIFTGGPGTAKTTVARLFARIMKDNGLLSKGHIVEVGRSDLVGRYVGWTAKTVKEKFEQAKGGVLFIDEAYSLVDDRGGSFGDEAINTIVQEMENMRSEVVVIFAGYTDKMEEFLDKNPGLRSRIAFHVPFPDYSTDELCDIAGLIGKKSGITFTDDAMEKLGRLFESAKGQYDFGNGRYVRNVIDKAKMNRATRLMALDFGEITRDAVSVIRAEDIDTPVSKKPCERVIGFTA